MTQKTSPFIEAKYGWDYGESGWNVGVDENFLKFSFLFDGSVDGIVDTLPVPVDGAAYALSTDKRFYFAINGIWNSCPIPKWFEFRIRSTGQRYLFDGSVWTAVAESTSPEDLAPLYQRVETIETTIPTKSPLDSPNFTGTPTAPTAPLGNNTTQIATTSFVNNEISNDRPYESTASSILMDGAASAGTSSTVARGDHRHPTDTTRAPLASPAFTGTPTAPTPTSTDNTTRLATTAFVKAAVDAMAGQQASALYVNVKDYGAVGNGVTDDTAAIKSALATGHSVFIPNGTYLISSALTLSYAQTLVGAGVDNAIIRVSGSGYDAVRLSTNYASVKGLTIRAESQRTSGAFVNITSSTRGNIVSEFKMQNAYEGIKISSNAVITYIEKGEILDTKATTGIAIVVNGGNDTFISQVVVAGSGTECLAGLAINNSQAVWVSDTDLLDCGIPLRISPGSGQLVTWCFFSQVALDTSNSDGIQIAPTSSATVKGLFFTNCWSSTNYRGVNIIASSGYVDTVHFNGCSFYNNSREGALVTGSLANGVEFNNCRFGGNSGASMGTYSGVKFSNSTNGFAVRGCRSGAHAGFGSSHKYGIEIGTSCNNYIIQDCDLSGNVTKGFLDSSASSSTARQVSLGLGTRTFAKGQVSIPAGSTSATVYHSLTGTPSTVNITPLNFNLAGASFWAGGLGSTTFSVNIGAAQSSAVTFNWSADIYG